MVGLDLTCGCTAHSSEALGARRSGRQISKRRFQETLPMPAPQTHRRHSAELPVAATRQPLTALTCGQQQRKPAALCECKGSVTDEDECRPTASKIEHEHAPIGTGCGMACTMVPSGERADGTNSTLRPPCDRPRCRARRAALKHANSCVAKAQLRLVMQAWRHVSQLQRALRRLESELPRRHHRPTLEASQLQQALRRQEAEILRRQHRMLENVLRERRQRRRAAAQEAIRNAIRNAASPQVPAATQPACGVLVIVARVLLVELACACALVAWVVACE